LICALIVSGAERRDALFTVASHQADVIERISGQRTAQHDDVTFQLGHLQVSNKSAASAVLSSTLSSEQRTLSFFGNAIADYCYHLIFFSSRVAVAECIFFYCENLTSSFFSALLRIVFVHPALCERAMQKLKLSSNANE